MQVSLLRAVAVVPPPDHLPNHIEEARPLSRCRRIFSDVLGHAPPISPGRIASIPSPA